MRDAEQVLNVLYLHNGVAKEVLKNRQSSPGATTKITDDIVPMSFTQVDNPARYFSRLVRHCGDAIKEKGDSALPIAAITHRLQQIVVDILMPAK